MANLGTIAKREDRTLKYGPAATIDASASTWSFRMGFRSAKTGADLTYADFGPSEYQATGDHADYWLIPLPAAKTTLLEVGHCQVGVFRTGSGTESLNNAGEDFVTVLDRPGNA